MHDSAWPALSYSDSAPQSQQENDAVVRRRRSSSSPPLEGSWETIQAHFRHRRLSSVVGGAGHDEGAVGEEELNLLAEGDRCPRRQYAEIVADIPQRAGRVCNWRHRRSHCWRLRLIFQRQCQSVHHVNTSVRRPIQVDADLGRVDVCDCWRSRKADRLSTMQNLSTGPDPNMVGQGYEDTAVSVHCFAVQQVTGYRLLPVWVQESRRSSTPGERLFGH